jgi:hypothetical protein
MWSGLSFLTQRSSAVSVPPPAYPHRITLAYNGEEDLTPAADTSRRFSRDEVDALEDITDDLQAMAKKEGEWTLPKGLFKVSRTIRLGSELHLTGAGRLETTLVLANDVNNNMFVNSGYVQKDIRNANIKVSNLRINGNQTAQAKPAHERRLSFCNGFYFADADGCSFQDLVLENILQTALHFRTCSRIDITRITAQDLGWSGVSTSGTSEIKVQDFYIHDSGNDHRHSAIHLDGGGKAYLQGRITKCVGNGIMLDSSFAPFSQAVVEVDASDCMRGVALVGSGEVQVHSVMIEGCKVRDNDIGIMVSNAHDVFVRGCRMERNRDYGLLFQGRAGGRDSIVSRCTFASNAKDVGEIHQSGGNILVDNVFAG